MIELRSTFNVTTWPMLLEILSRRQNTIKFFKEEVRQTLKDMGFIE